MLGGEDLPKKEQSNIISFYTKRPVKIRGIMNEEIENDKIYLGVLKNNDGLLARNLLEHLNIKHEQIINLTEEYEKLNDRYMQLLEDCFIYLKAEELDLRTDDIYIGEDFHVWLVKREE